MRLFCRYSLRSEFVPRSGLRCSPPVLVESTSDFVTPLASERVFLEVAVPERLQEMLREFGARIRRECQRLLQQGVDWNRHPAFYRAGRLSHRVFAVNRFMMQISCLRGSGTNFPGRSGMRPTAARSV